MDAFYVDDTEIRFNSDASIFYINETSYSYAAKNDRLIITHNASEIVAFNAVSIIINFGLEGVLNAYNSMIMQRSTLKYMCRGAEVFVDVENTEDAADMYEKYRLDFSGNRITNISCDEGYINDLRVYYGVVDAPFWKKIDDDGSVYKHETEQAFYVQLPAERLSDVEWMRRAHKPILEFIFNKSDERYYFQNTLVIFTDVQSVETQTIYTRDINQVILVFPSTETRRAESLMQSKNVLALSASAWDIASGKYTERTLHRYAGQHVIWDSDDTEQVYNTELVMKKIFDTYTAREILQEQVDKNIFWNSFGTYMLNKEIGYDSDAFVLLANIILAMKKRVFGVNGIQLETRNDLHDQIYANMRQKFERYKDGVVDTLKKEAKARALQQLSDFLKEEIPLTTFSTLAVPYKKPDVLK